MPALLRPVGMLKKYVQERSAVEIPDGISVREALQASGIPSELVALVLVNGQSQTKDYRIKDADEIQLIAIIGGG